MPIKDTIFQRLRNATEVELSSLAKFLTLDLTGDREVDIVNLSKKYRQAGNNALIGNFNKDHSEEYKDILWACVSRLSTLAEWKKPDFSDDYKEEWIEDYLLQAYMFAERLKIDKKVSKSDKEEARKKSELFLQGKKVETDALSVIGEWAIAAVGGFVGGLFWYVAIPFVIIAISTVFSTEPNIDKKLWPSTLILMQIRHRVSAELALINIGKVKS